MTDEIQQKWEAFHKFPTNFHEFGLKSTDYMVFYGLSTFADYKTGRSYPSYDKMNERIGISKATLSASLKRLLEAGFVRKHKRYHNSSIYFIGPNGKTQEKMAAAVDEMAENKVDKVQLLNLQKENEELKEEVKVQKLNNKSLETEQLKFNNCTVTKIKPSRSNYQDKGELEIQSSENEELTEKQKVEIIWSLYHENRPKQGRKLGEVAIKKAMKRKGFNIIKERLTEFNRIWSLWTDEQKKFLPMCSSWFNAERYDDDLESAKSHLKKSDLKRLEKREVVEVVQTVEKIPEVALSRLKSALRKYGPEISLDFLDQTLHSVIMGYGGWHTLHGKEFSDTKFMEFYALAKARGHKEAFVMGTQGLRPIKVELKEGE